MEKEKVIAARQQLGAKLKAIREQKGLRISRFAASCGFLRNLAVTSIEEGNTSYTIDNLISYLDALGYDVFSLFDSEFVKKE